MPHSKIPEIEALRIQRIKDTRKKKWPDGFKMSEKSKKQISEKNIGRKRTPEQNERNRQARLGKHLTRVHAKRISEALKGKVKPEGFGELARQRMLGTHPSEETKRKIGEKNRNHRHTPETIELIRRAAFEHLQEGKCFKKGVFHSTKSNCDIMYQSSYELKAYQILETSDTVKQFDRCNLLIEYEYKEKKKQYLPDIQVKYNDGSEVLIETKPLQFTQDPINLAKWEGARKYCSENNMVFVIWTEIELGLPYADRSYSQPQSEIFEGYRRT